MTRFVVEMPKWTRVFVVAAFILAFLSLTWMALHSGFHWYIWVTLAALMGVITRAMWMRPAKGAR
jgi:hypothetical protein